MTRQALLAGEVITMDGADGVFAPGAVLIDGVRIAAVGTPEIVPPGTRTTDLGDCTLLPGLVNAHTHAAMWLYRGRTEDAPRGEWLPRRIAPLTGRLGPADLRHGALAGCLEMLRNGTTTIADRYSEMETIAGAVEESGLRAVVAHSIYDATADADLAATSRLIAHYGTDPDRARVWTGVGPHATDSCGPEMLRECRRMADRWGARVFVHAAQSQAEVDAARLRGASGCAALLDDVGLLAPDVVLAHCTYLTGGEADLVGRRGAAVAHCPSSNAKLEGRIAPIGRLRDAGAVIGLGTDAACCNNGMDLFAEMRSAGLLNKVAADDPAAFPAVELLRMATTGSARALGIDHLVGSLEPGKRADVIAVRRRAPHLLPRHDAVAALVYSTHGADVVGVWIDGEPQVRDGRALHLDEDRILADGVRAAALLAPPAATSRTAVLG